MPSPGETLSFFALRYLRGGSRTAVLPSPLAVGDQVLPPTAFLDLRTRSPNALWLAERIRAPYRVGFGLRGLSYTLHEQIPFRSDRSLGQLFLDALPLLGLDPVKYHGPVLTGAGGEV